MTDHEDAATPPACLPPPHPVQMGPLQRIGLFSMPLESSDLCHRLGTKTKLSASVVL